MFVPTDTGEWVSEPYERLARIVHDYDPQFELRWIAPDQRVTLNDQAKPYVIWDTHTNTPVMFAGDSDSPVEILARLFDSDNKHGDVQKRMDAHNAAVQIMHMKEKMDLAEERQDYVRFLIGTKKNYINLGNGRKVDDHLRPIL